VSTAHPALVTFRVLPGLPSLRRADLVRSFEAAIAALRQRRGFRVVQYSIQTNHAHFVVEADRAEALGRGMMALGARFARTVNRTLGRSGRVLADRYHLRVLRTPREVRNALAYVLLNVRKHVAQVGRFAPVAIDPASSGRWFTGWVRGALPARDPPVVSPAGSWLLRVGWMRWGRIDLAETPGRLSHSTALRPGPALGRRSPTARLRPANAESSTRSPGPRRSVCR
jgi:hypothetical protein